MLEKILKWSEGRPLWQQDALRRLWSNTVLNSKDEEEIFCLLKEEDGLLSQDEEVSDKAIPLAATHMSVGGSTGDDVVLCGMYGLERVNAITPDGVLSFGQNGLTVIYGDNASGKSGYGRVLKSACRARGEQSRILPDVFSDHDSDLNATAHFVVSVNGGKESSVVWEDGVSSPIELASLEVFDSHVARVHIEDEKISYMPYGLDIFGKLAAICTSFQARLKGELSGEVEDFIPASLLELREESTPVGVFLDCLLQVNDNLHKSDLSVLQSAFDLLKKMSTSEEAEFVYLEDYFTSDPQKEIDNLVKAVESIDVCISAVADVDGLLSREKFKVCQKAFDDAKAARKVAEIASKDAFKDDPLPDVGGDVWRKLFDAAREYSLQVYPGKKFPVVDGHCPLCQQELQVEDGADRMKRFYKFIEDDVSKKADLAKVEYVKFLSIKGEIEKSVDELASAVDIVESHSLWLFDILSKYLCFVRSVLGRFNNVYLKGSWVHMKSIDEAYCVSPIFALKELRSYLERSILKLKSGLNPVERHKMMMRYNKLKQKRRFISDVENVERCMQMISKKLDLKKCISNLNPRGITEFSRKISEELVDKALSEHLSSELAQLGAGEIHVVLDGNVKKGEWHHKLIIGADDIGGTAITVLSEGEQRIVALASFMAELSMTESLCGLVFDDPVCSLDHHWRISVAKRLVREARKRQVIIFTHDIAFFSELEKAVVDSKMESVAKSDPSLEVPFCSRLVQKKVGVSGYCDDEQLPWQLKSARARCGILKNELVVIRKMYEKGDDDELYKSKVAHFYHDLRDTWERAVEMDLLCGVVQRFSTDVKTKKLDMVSVENSDNAKIDRGMTRCSARSHDVPILADISSIEPDVIEVDWAELEAFLSDLKARRKVTEGDRSLDPVSPKILDMKSFIKQERRGGAFKKSVSSGTEECLPEEFEQVAEG